MTATPKEVALTGGTGFIGATILEALTRNGYRVRALTRRPAAPRDGVCWVQGDLHNLAALDELIAGSDALLHCAGAVRGWQLPSFAAANVTGAANIARIARANRVSVLHFSSLAAREPHLSSYALSKNLGEAALREHLGGDCTVLRPPAVYGPGDEELTPLFELLLRGSLTAVPSTNGVFALLHVEDLTTAALRWLEKASADGEVYELSDGRPGYRWSELFDRVAALTGSRPRTFRVPAALMYAVGRANFAVSHVRGEPPMLTPGKVRELLFPDWSSTDDRFEKRYGWQPTFTLETGLTQLAQQLGLGVSHA